MDIARALPWPLTPARWGQTLRRSHGPTVARCSLPHVARPHVLTFESISHNAYTSQDIVRFSTH